MATVPIFKGLLLLHISLAIAQTSTKLDTPQLNTTTSLEGYIAQLERHYASIISRDEELVADFRANFQSRLATIDAQRVFVEGELEAVDSKFYTLQFLSDLSKHCVQKYQGLLNTANNVRRIFNSCLITARSNLNVVLSSPEMNMRSLSNSFNIEFKNGLGNCNRTHNASYTNHTICVLTYNNRFSLRFNYLQRAFEADLETARCSAETRIRQAVECVFKTVNATISSIGTSTNAVDNCIQALELCKPCQNGNGNNDTAIAVAESQCPYVMNVTISTNVDVTRNETITNPLRGLHPNIPCILINYIYEEN